jgi:hypothetical protein
MAIAAFDVNDLVEVRCTFTNDSGVNTNPSTVSLQVKEPDGTITTYAQGTLTNSATGVWQKNVTPDAAGLWYYRFSGTGTVTQEQEGVFFVRKSAFS